MTNGRRRVLAFTFKLGQKKAQLGSAMETVKISSKCVVSTINTGSGFHGSSVLRLFLILLGKKNYIITNNNNPPAASTECRHYTPQQ